MTFNYYSILLKDKLQIPQNDKIPIQDVFKKFAFHESGEPNLDPNTVKLYNKDDDKSPYNRMLLHILIDEDYDDLVEYFLLKNPIKCDPNLIDIQTSITPLNNAIQC